jgi:WD40 repeat protein
VDKTAHAKPKIGSVGWSLNDELIITGLHSRKAPIKVWDTRITEKVPDKNGPGFTIQPTMLYSLKGHDAAVISVDAHPTDPRIYLSAGYDSRFMMWNVYTGEILLEMQRDNDIDMRLTTAAADSGPSFADCHFSPHGDSFIVSDKNGMLFIFGNRPKAPYSLGPADQFFKVRPTLVLNCTSLLPSNHYRVIITLSNLMLPVP